MEYWQLLKRPEWQKKRLEMLNSAGWKCQNCGSKDNTLHVHHKQYFKGKDPWDYESDQLEVLCDECHNVQHQSIQNIKEIVSVSDVNEIYNLLLGYSPTDIYKKLTNYEDVSNFCAETQVIGTIAKLLTFVDPRKYGDIAEAIIEVARLDEKEEAENFFRQNYFPEVGWEE